MIPRSWVRTWAPPLLQGIQASLRLLDLPCPRPSSPSSPPSPLPASRPPAGPPSLPHSDTPPSSLDIPLRSFHRLLSLKPAPANGNEMLATHVIFGCRILHVNLSSLTRVGTHVPCSGGGVLTTGPSGKSPYV